MTQQEVQGNCLMFDFVSLVLPMCQGNSVFDPPHKPLSKVSGIILSVKRRSRDSETLPEVSELVCVVPRHHRKREGRPYTRGPGAEK